METVASPFLVGRNRDLGYQVILTPPFLGDKTLNDVLLQVVRGEESAPRSVVCREIRGTSIGNLSVVFRVVVATEKDYGLGKRGEIEDAFGRPIRLFEGVVIRDTIDSLSDLVLTQRDIQLAHDQAKAAYKAFWRESRSFKPWASQPFQVNTNANLKDQVQLIVDVPLEIPQLSHGQHRSFFSLEPLKTQSSSGIQQRSFFSYRQPKRSQPLKIAIVGILCLMILLSGIFVVIPLYKSVDLTPTLTPVRPHTPQVEPPRTGSTLAYDPIHHMTLLFGGTMQAAGGSATNQTWIWNGKAWKQLHPKSSPPTLSGIMVYDAFSQSIILFLNQVKSEGRIANKMWMWDGANWHQLYPAVMPEVLRASMVYDEAHHQIVLFGGEALSGNSSRVFMNATWTWNGNTWQKQHPVASPSPRSGALMAYDAAHQQVVLYGGTTRDGASFETWTWNGNTWQQYQEADIQPQHQNAVLIYDEATKQTLLFGGTITGETQSSSREMWLWTGIDWTRLTTQDSAPNAPNESAIFDGDTQTIVVYAILGSVNEFSTPSASVPVSKTWVWNGKIWILLS